MPDLLALLEQHREAVLLGEFGGFLHMFGKASSEFLRATSLDGTGNDSHQDLKHLGPVADLLKNPALKRDFVFFGGAEQLAGDFTDFVTNYARNDRHPEKGPNSHLLSLFNTCHRMTSADEKGVVRRQQSVSRIRIATPFGGAGAIISPDEIDGIRDNMAADLAVSLKEYLPGSGAAQELRKRAIAVLRPGMSRTLGETREPANDVTLWDQSFGVASLYKSCLAAMAMGKEPCPRGSADWEYDKTQWRLLGIGWSGLAFLQRGRRAADILYRREITKEAVNQIRELLEVTYPVGNLFYSDLNGAFFTFPGIDATTADALIDQLAPQIASAVREVSDNELWPFFTLSRPRRTLTALAREIQVRDQFAATPCVAALLSTEHEQSGGSTRRVERLLVPGPPLPLPRMAEEDVCPVCRFRSKPAARETCPVCRKRRSGRQDIWLKEPAGQTIWVDEIADASNRIALLTLRFDLSRWLSGEWFSTIPTQTFDDWFGGERMQRLQSNSQQWGRVQQTVSSPGPNAATAVALLEICLNNPSRDPGLKASVLRTFLRDIDVRQVEYQKHVENLRGRIDDSGVGALTAGDFASFFFTQSASPGRLMRVWEAAQGFIHCLVERIAKDVFSQRPERLWFKTTTDIAGVEAEATYRVAVPNLEGGPLVVLALNPHDFLTVDCLDRFRLRDEKQCAGSNAVRKALGAGRIESYRAEVTGELVAGAASISQLQAYGDYLPFTVLSDTPPLTQILLPAKRVPEVIEKLLFLEKEHFGAVRGKLVLHTGVLVAKRKLPLYALLEAGQRILSHPGLGKGIEQKARFSAECHNDFYCHYPTREPEHGRHPIGTLSPLHADQPYWLTTGYFDFDFLGATVDRQRLQYEVAPSPVRPSISYGWLHPRPIESPRLREMFQIWRLLSQVGPTQRHEIEAALSSKLEQWRAVGGDAQRVFHGFARVVLADSFGSSWRTLSEEDRRLLLGALADGLLLDTIQFFDHVVKGDVIE